MRKIFLFFAICIIVIGSASCASNAEEDFYGRYVFDNVSYLSPLSSSTVDGIEQGMAGTKYTIEKDLFMVEFEEAKVEIISPAYLKEEIPTDFNVLNDAACFLGNEIEWQYTVYDEDGNKTDWRIYVSSDSLWVSAFVDNTADGSEIIMNAYKLSPPE